MKCGKQPKNNQNLVKLNLPNGTSSLGIGFTIGFLNPSIILALAGTGLPLATMISYPLLRRRRIIAKYQQSQQHLIKP